MKHTKTIALILTMILSLTLVIGMLMPTVSAEETAAPVTETEEVASEGANENDVLSSKAIAAAIAVAVVGAAGAIGMALAIAKSAEGMARQPEAAGKINSAMMLGLVFIETAIIYALIVAILIIFVL